MPSSPSAFQWVSLAVIILLAFAGGCPPLSRPERSREIGGFPGGERFAAGAFPALALCIMLPPGFLLTAFVRFLVGAARQLRAGEERASSGCRQ